MSASEYLRGLDLNIANLPRSARPLRDLRGVVAGTIYDTFDDQFVGLDINLVNHDAGVRTVLIDGLPYNIASGASKAVTNAPFHKVEVQSGADIDLEIQGIPIQTVERLTKKSVKVEMQTWQ